MTATAARETLEVTMTGPATAAVGQDVDFVAVVTNRGTVPTRADGDRRSLRRRPATPQPARPARTRSRTTRARPVATNRGHASQSPRRASCATRSNCWKAKRIRGTAKACVTVAAAAAPAAAAPQARGTRPKPDQPAAATQPLTVTKSGPDRLSVGQKANFIVEITNHSAITLTQVRLIDSYDRAIRPESLRPTTPGKGMTSSGSCRRCRLARRCSSRCWVRPPCRWPTPAIASW